MYQAGRFFQSRAGRNGAEEFFRRTRLLFPPPCAILYPGGKTDTIMKTFHLKDFKSGELPIALNIQRWQKDNLSSEHLHDCIEVIYVLSGNGVNFIDNRTFPTIAGDLYVVARGATHSFYSNTELVFYNLMFQPALFGQREREYFREHPGFLPLFEPPEGSVLNKLSLPPAANERIRALFDHLHAELTGGVPGSQMAAKAYLTLLISEICRCREALRHAPSSLSRGDNQFNSLSRIIEFINSSYLEPLDLERAAAAAGLSPSYVGEFFRARTGVPLVRYLSVLRVERAQELLRERPEWNISEIAARCGFDDSSYFTRVFRKLTGKTPREFRKFSGK